MPLQSRHRPLEVPAEGSRVVVISAIRESSEGNRLGGADLSFDVSGDMASKGRSSLKIVASRGVCGASAHAGVARR